MKGLQGVSPLKCPCALCWENILPSSYVSKCPYLCAVSGLPSLYGFTAKVQRNLVKSQAGIYKLALLDFLHHPSTCQIISVSIIFRHYLYPTCHFEKCSDVLMITMSDKLQELQNTRWHPHPAHPRSTLLEGLPILWSSQLPWRVNFRLDGPCFTSSGVSSHQRTLDPLCLAPKPSLKTLCALCLPQLVCSAMQVDSTKGQSMLEPSAEALQGFCRA